jgi:hypothetical protein
MVCWVTAHDIMLLCHGSGVKLLGPMCANGMLTRCSYLTSVPVTGVEHD